MKTLSPSHSIISRFFIILLVGLVAAAVHSETQNGSPDRYVGSNWTFLDAKKALSSAAEITLTKYPNCDQATVEEKIVQVYHSDGTGENQDEAYVKVLTEKGKQDSRTLSLEFDLPYSTVSVVKLDVIKATGETVPVDVAANSKETIENSQISSNIYDPNLKVLKVNIPGLDIGDVVHEVVRRTIMRSIIPGEFNDENVFEGTGYVRHLTYEVYAPSDKPLKHMNLRNEIPGTVKYTTRYAKDDILVQRWEVSNVPRMFDEPSMPPYENVLQRVLISTTPTWQDVSKWYWELSKPHLEATTPELKAKVEELTAGAKTDLDKVKALFYYVSQNIRYMGLTPEKDRPGFEPHDVSMTFGKKYGVCRDKAALLVAMLRTAGLNGYPVLINVGSKKDKDVPDAWFNHAIVCVELEKGKYTLMDPTDEHSRELLPSYDLDQSYLVARPEGENIQVSPIHSPDENLMRIRTIGTLKATGELSAKSELSFGGANDDIYRGEFSHMKPDDLRRFFERCLKRAMPGARLTSFKLTPENMLDVTQEVHAEIEFSVEGMTATGNGKAVASLPWIGKNMGLVTFIIRNIGLDKRKYPLQTSIACGLDETISLKLGDGFAGTESTPSATPVDNACMSYLQSVQEKNGVLECSRELKLKVVEFSPEQYLELKNTLKKMEFDARKSPVLTVANSPSTSPEIAPGTVPPINSNAIILESHKELNVTDAHTAVYRVKYSKLILTYAGKVREAEVKVDFNPACEEAKIIHGIVTSKTGQRQEISPAEINVMDAEWSASAKRYTGGKILVANLPGVEIGSTIEVEYEITKKNEPFLVGFEAFQLMDELKKKTFQVTLPDNLKLEKFVTGGSSIPVESKVGGTGYLWSSEKMGALPEEPQLPPSWLSIPGVTYFIGDFKAYLKELNETLLNRSQSRVKAEKLAKQIAASTKNRLEVVRAIRNFVAKTIRQAGPSFTELPLSELSTADTTLTDGYGHAADRAILLHAMLTAAGFQPEFVLASELPPVDEIQKTATTFPLPESFDTPLIKLTLDGMTYYLNDTDQYAKMGSTAHDNKLGIVLTSQTFEVIQASKDCANKTDILYALTLTDSGKLRMKITKHFYGDEYNKKKRFFAELRPEERKRYQQEMVSRVAQGARPVGDLTTEFDAYPGTEQFAVDLDNYAVVEGKYLYFDLPFTPSLFELSGGDQRSLPMMLLQDGKETIRTEISLPASFREVVISPKDENLDAPSKSGTVRMTSSTADGKFILNTELTTSPAIIHPQDYPEILRVESALKKKSAEVILLQKK